MGAADPLALFPVNQIALMDLDELSFWCLHRATSGDRLIALFGRIVDGEQVIVTAVLQAVTGEIAVRRAHAVRTDYYPSITARFPAAQIFERELWEQTGLTPVGHPWLKPVRYEGERQQHMHEHSFFSVRGQEVHEVGVGPIHASVIEPGHFRFMCLGEQVHHLEIQLGYQHRGVEALLLQRPPLALTSLVESIAGDSSIAYAWSYCAAIEALSGKPVALETDVVRGVALELERIAMHLTALTGLATDIAFLQGGATYGRLRTAIINTTMRVCGSRFGRGWLRPGGVRFAVTDALRRDLLATLAAFSTDMSEVNQLMLGARSVQSRFKGIGQINKPAARDLGLVGLVARACGLAIDSRSNTPGELYRVQPLFTMMEATGDCWARLRIRMSEIDESVRWIARVLQAATFDLAAPTITVPGLLQPETMCVSMREGFRGQIVHVVETDSAGSIVHYKVQDPSLINWFGLALAVRNNEISDFPICNKSFDLSYCGNDL